MAQTNHFLPYNNIHCLVINTSDHHHILHEKDSYIAQLTCKLQTVINEKEKKEEMITTLQTQLQEYKQQNLPRTPQNTTGLLLL